MENPAHKANFPTNTAEGVFDDVFAISMEDFKELKPDLWVEIAVRQCLAGALIDESRYKDAVENLEATLIVKLDDEYRERLKSVQLAMEGKAPYEDITRVPLDEIPIRRAPYKFKALMQLIDRRKPQEATLEL